MSLYVAIFPDLGKYKDWISKTREEFDPGSRFVEPHLTLVFPTESLSLIELREEISNRSGKFSSFQVALRSAIIMPDLFSDHEKFHVFLVPDEGLSQLVRLHNALYSGKLSKDLRLDIPFIPHLTVGANLTQECAKGLMDKLNSEVFEIRFDVDELYLGETRGELSDKIHDSPIDLMKARARSTESV